MTLSLPLMIGLLAYALYILAFAVKSFLLLRVLMMFALIAESLYMAFPDPGEPLWLGIVCNVIIFATNGWHIALYLRDHFGFRLNEVEAALYRRVFAAHFSRVDFVRLLRAAAWREFADGETLLREGEPVHAMLLIEEGCAVVCAAGHEVARLGPGSLLGEMAYLTEAPASATVTAAGSLRTLSLEHDKLEALIKRHPELETPLQSFIGHDMVDKLKRRHALASQGA
ncbi:Crp/Fnr family transcriptional regulator [Crenobacter intestini]|uniref:Cyclic nucleotide-binding domain-containing protein n=1 Tax=Crenobacter intestini TaxID=2563443 RepID=A0A4T0UTM5_9NEIS|nr:cyclic nucleotide-binding domain-containing protein [Crenobacter intestini]TIC82320.1 cyclic nucleotide-binding domain-containing protein [Crenobacter intestini]